MSIRSRLSLWKILVICTILEIIILLYCPGLFDYSDQDNLTWMLLAANYAGFILFNAWEVIYLKSNTVCPAGVSVPLTTGGEIHQKGIWTYMFGGNSPLSAGYNTHTSGPGGLQHEGRDMIIALGTHCHRVGGIEGGEKRHIMITGQTEQRSTRFTPFEIKSKRDERRNPPQNIYIAYFSSKEYSLFRNHQISKATTDESKSTRIDLTSLVSENLALDMDYDIIRAFQLGDSSPIKEMVEQFMSLLNVKSPNQSSISSFLRQDTRGEDGDDI